MASIYDALLDPTGETASTPEKAAALAAALKRQSAYGSLGQLMGVQPTQQAGAAIRDSAQGSLKMALAQRQAERESATRAAERKQAEQWQQQNFQQRERGIEATRINQASAQDIARQRLDIQQSAAEAAAAAKQSAADIKADDAARKSRKDQDVVLSALSVANEGLLSVEELLAHPGREAATGASSLSSILPGTKSRDYKLLADKLAASAFMQAREGLKGAGAVTDYEGATAQRAITILGDRTASEEQHEQALRDFQDVLNSVATKNAIRARELGISPELMETTKPKRRPAAGAAPEAPANRKQIGGQWYYEQNGEWFAE